MADDLFDVVSRVADGMGVVGAPISGVRAWLRRDEARNLLRALERELEGRWEQATRRDVYEQIARLMQQPGLWVPFEAVTQGDASALEAVRDYLSRHIGAESAAASREVAQAVHDVLEAHVGRAQKNPEAAVDIVGRLRQGQTDRRFDAVDEAIGSILSRLDVAPQQEPAASGGDEQRAPTSLIGLPRDLPDFTGRAAQISELLDVLRDADRQTNAVVITAIAGKPGVGKSVLANHVAHRVRHEYPDAQLYVNLHGLGPGRLDPDTALAGLLQALGFRVDQIPQELEGRAALYRSELATRRALIVLDDAYDEAQVRPLLPGSATCAVIVTSREPLAALEGALLYELEVMEPDEAIELLDRLAGRDRVSAEADIAKEIVQLCGALPLAVQITGRVLAKRSKWTLAKIARRLRDEARRLDELQINDLEVRRSFALSYDDLSPGLRALFRRVSLLPGSDFGADVASAMHSSAVDATERQLDRLADAQLLETPAEGRYRFHDLIALFARERAQVEDSVQGRRKYASAAREWYLEETRRANTQLSIAPSNLGENRSRAEALDWLTLEHRNLVSAIEQAHEAEEWRVTCELARALTHFFSLRGHWDDWQRTHELAVDAARRGSNRRAEADVLNDLGIVYGKVGRWDDSIRCHELSKAIMLELDDRAGEARAIGNLGVACIRQGRVAAAVPLFEQHLAIARELGDRNGEAGTLINLGLIYAVAGRSDDAKTSFEQARKIMHELGDRRGEGECVAGLGILCAHEKRWEDAVARYDEHLAMSRDLGDRHAEAATLNNMGNAYSGLESWQDALHCYERSSEIMHELGDRHAEAQALRNIGRTLRVTGDEAGATRHLTDALRMFDELGAAEADATRRDLDLPLD